jgi:hypothetical protein
VQITSGALFGQHGLFAGMKGTDRVFVLLGLLGKERSVELGKASIRPV